MFMQVEGNLKRRVLLRIERDSYRQVGTGACNHLRIRQIDCWREAADRLSLCAANRCAVRRGDRECGLLDAAGVEARSRRDQFHIRRSREVDGTPSHSQPAKVVAARDREEPTAVRQAADNKAQKRAAVDRPTGRVQS